MIAKNTLAAGLVALSALAAAPAHAGGLTIQFGHGPGWGWQQQHQRLSPREVRFMLRDQGYRHINFVDRRGPTYQVRASKRGRDFYLVVNARTGHIVHRHRI